MVKKTFSVSVGEEAVEQLDRVVRKGRFANRSQAVEYCVRQILEFEDYKDKYSEIVVDFLDGIEKCPQMIGKIRKILKEEGD
ncbi:MAG: ribbon-helix-helix protein, CopG family [Methanophagales archaeon]|nr:ribbon-helix-helix protein, CopG family [Methanophagales archaeon]